MTKPASHDWLIAATLGDLPRLKALAERMGMSRCLAMTDVAGLTALHRAASRGCDETIDWLIGQGIAADTLTHRRLTALDFACRGVHAGAVDRLLRAGTVPVRPHAAGGFSWLLKNRPKTVEGWHAIEHRMVEVWDLLAAATPVDWDEWLVVDFVQHAPPALIRHVLPTLSRETLFPNASSSYLPERYSLIREFGWKNVGRPHALAPLEVERMEAWLAFDDGLPQAASVSFLIREALRGGDDMNLLQEFAWRGDKSCIPHVKALLDMGFDVNGADSAGDTVLMSAIQKNPPLVPLLLEHGASLDGGDLQDPGKNALSQAFVWTPSLLPLLMKAPGAAAALRAMGPGLVWDVASGHPHRWTRFLETCPEMAPHVPLLCFKGALLAEEGISSEGDPVPGEDFPAQDADRNRHRAILAGFVHENLGRHPGESPFLDARDWLDQPEAMQTLWDRASPAWRAGLEEALSRPYVEVESWRDVVYETHARHPTPFSRHMMDCLMPVMSIHDFIRAPELVPALFWQWVHSPEKVSALDWENGIHAPRSFSGLLKLMAHHLGTERAPILESMFGFLKEAGPLATLRDRGGEGLLDSYLRHCHSHDLPVHTDAFALCVATQPRTLHLRNHAGQTALHCAAVCKSVEMVIHLIENGFSLGEKDANGQTPLDLLEGDARLAVLAWQEQRTLSALLEKAGTDTPDGLPVRRGGRRL